MESLANVVPPGAAPRAAAWGGIGTLSLRVSGPSHQGPPQLPQQLATGGGLTGGPRARASQPGWAGIAGVAGWLANSDRWLAGWLAG